MVLDGGNGNKHVRIQFESYQPGTYMSIDDWGSVGGAFPIGLGAKLARPDRPVMCSMGDMGMMVNLGELETAVREKCNFVHLVWCDGSYDMVKIQQLLKYHRPFGVDFGPVDIVKYAEAFGATGLRIHSADEIGPVLRQALNTPGPVLVEIPIDYRHNQDLCAIVSENATS